MTTKDYKNGKIYKIEPVNGDDGDIYIGSTTKKYLSQRMTAHKYSYTQWKKNNILTNISSFNLFDKYGVENCKITLLEIYSCESNDELKAKEAEYIKLYNCVNKNIPNRTQKEYYSDNKEYILDRCKQFYVDNKDKIIERNKEWSNNNKEKHLSLQKEWYKKII